MKIYFKPDGIWYFYEDLDKSYDVLADGDWGSIDVPDETEEEQIQQIVDTILGVYK